MSNTNQVRALVLIYAQPRATTLEKYDVNALSMAILKAVQNRTNFDRLYVVSPIFGTVCDAYITDYQDGSPGKSTALTQVVGNTRRRELNLPEALEVRFATSLHPEVRTIFMPSFIRTDGIDVVDIIDTTVEMLAQAPEDALA